MEKNVKVCKENLDNIYSKLDKKFNYVYNMRQLRSGARKTIMEVKYEHDYS